MLSQHIRQLYCWKWNLFNSEVIFNKNLCQEDGKCPPSITPMGLLLHMSVHPLHSGPPHGLPDDHSIERLGACDHETSCGTLIMTVADDPYWFCMVTRSHYLNQGHMWPQAVKWFLRMITDMVYERFRDSLGSWNLHRDTGHWPADLKCLLIFWSLGQMSRSQWPEAVKWFPDDNSRTLRPGITKLHRDIGHDRQMTPIDFQVTRSKVKVTVTWNSKMVSGW